MVEEGKPILWNPSKCISWMVWVFTYEFSELWRRRIWLKRRRDSPPPKEDRCNLFSRWSYTDRPCRWLKKNKLSLERLKIDAVCKQFLRLKLEEQRLEEINYPYKHASNIRNDDMIVSKWIAKKEIAFAIRSPVRRRIWQNWSTSLIFHTTLTYLIAMIGFGMGKKAISLPKLYEDWLWIPLPLAIIQFYTRFVSSRRAVISFSKNPAITHLNDHTRSFRV